VVHPLYAVTVGLEDAFSKRCEAVESSVEGLFR
jgi:hypothetical protein